MSRMRIHRLHIVIAVMVCALAVLQYRLWFESGGIRDMIKLKEHLALQEKDNDRLRQRNDELLFQIQRLQNSKDATESRARNELGMIKKDEKFYQIVR